MGRRALLAVPQTQPRAVMYGRVSAVMGRGDDLTSPELQEHVVREYCLRRGYEPVSWLCDVDLSGRSWSRRQVEQAVKMVEAGQIDVIVVPRWSRFTRNLRDYVVQTARIEAAGGRVESALEETDPATAAGLLQRDLFAILAQWESRKIGETWKETHARRNRQGLPHQNRPRLGYQIIDGKYVPLPSEAAVVSEAYRRYLTGTGIREIHRWLETQGVRSKSRGTRLSFHGVLELLDSGFAAGLLRVGGEYVPGAHEPIISPQVWEQFTTARRGRRTVAPRHVNPTTPLAGIVRCAACNNRMGRRNNFDRQGVPRWNSYQCDNGLCPDRPRVSQRAAEEYVKGWLTELCDGTYERTVDVVTRNAQAALTEADRTVLLDKLADVEAGIDTIEEMFLTRQYTAERRTRLLARLGNQRDELNQRLQDFTADPAVVMPTAADVAEMLDAWDVLPPQEVNRWLAGLVRDLLVTRNPQPRHPPNMQVIATWER